MTAPVERRGTRHKSERLLRACEILRFGAVGASSTLLYLAVYAVIVLAGVPFVLASVAAFFPVAVYGYVMHDRWTFRTRAASRGGLARWFLLQGTVGGLNTLALWGLVVLAGIDRLIAQLILLPLLPMTTYLLSRRRVFGMA